ncbi:MAG: LysM peptidoglycan-binding domain-containing protein [Chloroflexi bacterium]|nr:LysM peptidoglycan-binding domain-containing protein [Chloroflexota bacterium]
MARQTGILLLLILAVSACSLAQVVAPAPAPSPLPTVYATYTVQPGDTLSQIAVRFRVTLEQLIALNVDRYPTLARDPSTIRVGWELRVPQPNAAVRETATADASFPQVDLNQAARLVVEGINSARARYGLVLFRSDVALTRIATDRSTDMIAREYFSHYDPQTGQEPLLRNLQANNFAYQYAGENIAEIKNDAGWVPPLLTVAARYSAEDLANEFVTGWLNSPDHRANILNSHYRRTGVALAVSRDGRRIVATQVFSD